MRAASAWKALLLAAAAAAAGCGVEEGVRGGGDGDGGQDGDGDAGDADAGVDECEGVDFPVAGRPPKALIALDRSASMAQSEDETTPWDACTEAIAGITAALDDRIDFGLQLFPGLDETCAPPSAIPDVPVGPGTGAAIADALEPGPLGYGTPIAASLGLAYAYLTGLPPDDDVRFVILATDGAPNCSDNPMYDCETCVWTGDFCGSPLACLDDVGTYSVVTEYHDNWGIDTYVIGLGGVGDDWDEVMSNAAWYGGTGDYYAAQTDEGAADMIAALQEISAENTECVFDVDWEALGEGVSQDPDLVNLLVDGDVVPFSADCSNGEGWRWADGDTIELCQGLCEDYRWGVVSSVHASFGCDTVVT